MDQAAAFRLNGVKIKKIPEQEISFVAFHDAAWGNVDREDPDIGSPEWTGEHPVSSQLAHVILICGAKLLDGEESEALEHSIYLRSLFMSFAEGRLVQEKDCGAYVPIHCITNCKDLYDRLMREGTPKAPTEKRLAIDLAGPRQILMKEARHQFAKKHGDNQEPTPSMPCRPPIHWVPTELQLADILTKDWRRQNGGQQWRRVVLFSLSRSSEISTDFQDLIAVSMHCIIRVFDLSQLDDIWHTGQLSGPRVRIHVKKCLRSCSVLMS